MFMTAQIFAIALGADAPLTLPQPATPPEFIQVQDSKDRRTRARSDDPCPPGVACFDRGSRIDKDGNRDRNWERTRDRDRSRDRYRWRDRDRWSNRWDRDDDWRWRNRDRFRSGIYLDINPFGYRPTYRPRYFGNSHVNWCLNRYRSYDPATNRWLSYSGEYRVCVSPFS